MLTNTSYDLNVQLRRGFNIGGISFGLIALVVTLMDITRWRQKDRSRGVMRVQLYTLFLILGDVLYNLASLIGGLENLNNDSAISESVCKVTSVCNLFSSSFALLWGLFLPLELIPLQSSYIGSKGTALASAPCCLKCIIRLLSLSPKMLLFSTFAISLAAGCLPLASSTGVATRQYGICDFEESNYYYNGASLFNLTILLASMVAFFLFFFRAKRSDNCGARGGARATIISLASLPLYQFVCYIPFIIVTLNENPYKSALRLEGKLSPDIYTVHSIMFPSQSIYNALVLLFLLFRNLIWCRCCANYSSNPTSTSSVPSDVLNLSSKFTQKSIFEISNQEIIRFSQINSFCLNYYIRK